MKPYRRNASAVILRPDGTVLLLKKPRTTHAWQLPQGGIEEGETVEQAALRELKEEAGIDDCGLLGRLEPVYRYDYPEGFNRFPEYRGQEVSFVAASVDASVVVMIDQKEIVDFAWVTVPELTTYIDRPEYLELLQSLIAEAISLLPRS